MYYPNVIYHVYNHTNNKESLFRNEANYLLFLKKLRTHLLPVADLMCYCLMPTHFHLQLLPKAVGCEPFITASGSSNQQQLHAAFRTLLSSYTQAVNKEHDRRGSLLRAKTKYLPAYADFIPEDWELKEELPFTLYVPYIRVAFDYIHDNPVRAGLVRDAEDWSYSSARDYAGLREGTVCNMELTRRLLGV